MLDENDNIVTRRDDVVSLLLGLRYLTEADTTYIVEYYRNGPGFSEAETRDFFMFTQDAVDNFDAIGSQTQLQQARMLSRAGYAHQTPGRDYLYLRVSQKEPFDILYFTPSIVSIVNLDDRSFSLTPAPLHRDYQLRDPPEGRGERRGPAQRVRREAGRR